MKKNIVWHLIAIIAIAWSIFSFLTYLSLQRENNVLNATLVSAKQSLTKTTQIVAELREENISMKDNLSKVAQKNDSLLAEIGQARQMLTAKTEELNAAKKILKDLEENNKGMSGRVNSLNLEKEALRNRISALTDETDQLRSRLNSLKELKIAIHQIKQKQLEEKILALRETDSKNLKAGNQGYVVKDGKPMLGYKKTVKVLPAKL